MNKYEDIINLERPISANHEKMPIEKRASIFLPFAALSGFSDKIKEVERFKDNKRILSIDANNDLNLKINEINNNLKEKISITYFNNNTYKTVNCTIKKIDKINRVIILENQEKVLFDDILDIKENNLE